MTTLPTFKGYTVDVRLKEFRRIQYGKKWDLIPFDSPKGGVLLEKFIATINPHTPQGLQLLSDIWA